MSEKFVAGTTWSRKRRHWALAETLEAYVHGGRTGPALCWQAGGITDQMATDAEARHYGFSRAAVVADMPPCKACEKKRERMEGQPS